MGRLSHTYTDPWICSRTCQGSPKKGSRDGSEEGAEAKGVTHVRPAVLDDFIRKFLIKVDMPRTLDAFNTEWYVARKEWQGERRGVNAAYEHRGEGDEEIGDVHGGGRGET
jgi:hypothetical protein